MLNVKVVIKISSKYLLARSRCVLFPEFHSRILAFFFHLRGLCTLFLLLGVVLLSVQFLSLLISPRSLSLWLLPGLLNSPWQSRPHAFLEVEGPSSGSSWLSCLVVGELQPSATMPVSFSLLLRCWTSLSNSPFFCLKLFSLFGSESDISNSLPLKLVSSIASAASVLILPALPLLAMANKEEQKRLKETVTVQVDRC